MVRHRDRLIVDKRHFKMTVPGQQPPVSNHPAVQALGIAEYYLKWPVDGVNLREKTLGYRFIPFAWLTVSYYGPSLLLGQFLN